MYTNPMNVLCVPLIASINEFLCRSICCCIESIDAVLYPWTMIVHTVHGRPRDNDIMYIF